jgi:hypothetical protein
MNDARGPFPKAAGRNSGFSQSEFLSTGRAAFRVEGVEFLEINQQCVFSAQGVFHYGCSGRSTKKGIGYGFGQIVIFSDYGRSRPLSSAWAAGSLLLPNRSFDGCYQIASDKLDTAGQKSRAKRPSPLHWNIAGDGATRRKRRSAGISL